MMSGFNPIILNDFCDKGITALQQVTPWKLLTSTLSSPRYTIFF